MKAEINPMHFDYITKADQKWYGREINYCCNNLNAQKQKNYTRYMQDLLLVLQINMQSKRKNI
jgi:hypothetical protein